MPRITKLQEEINEERFEKLYCGCEEAYDYISPQGNASGSQSEEQIREFDEITRPRHYCFSEVEPLAVIEAWKLEFHEASAVTYIARAEHKNNRVSDLKKAAEYLRRKIELLENRKSKISV